MSSLINVSINLQDLPKEKFVQGKKEFIIILPYR